ncbi:MAG TPA: DUF378 domain-containing protein [candidate division Zixibacteria bacterium]|nr:DUF378 domain-containing protein [candidate division Zixibacteria bacterium]HEQ98107.1 DUF378 domain-containing protein [candidate division Zixibacteria bacterium]
MKALDVIFLILLVVGGLNWGLVGIFNFNLVAAIFGEMSVISRIIYILVGIAALYNLVLWKSMQQRWGRGHAPATA